MNFYKEIIYLQARWFEEIHSTVSFVHDECKYFEIAVDGNRQQESEEHCTLVDEQGQGLEVIFMFTALRY